MGDSDLRGEHSILPEVRRAILAFRSSYITSTEVEPIRQPQPFLLNAGEGSHPREAELWKDRYSYRSATIGSTFVARRAGM